MFKEIKKELNTLIRNGDLAQFFSVVKKNIVQTSELNTEFLHINSRFSILEKSQRSGTISKIDSDLEINKITSAVLELVKKLENEDIVKSIIPFKEQNKKGLEKDSFLRILELNGKRRKLKSEEGLNDYNKQFDDFTSELETLTDEYCKIGYYKYSIKKTEGKVHLVSVEKVYIKVSPCTDDDKRFIWLTIEDHTDRKLEKSQRSTLDIFELNYSSNLDLIWRSRNDSNVEKSHTELAKMLLERALTILIETEKNL